MIGGTSKSGNGNEYKEKWELRPLLQFTTENNWIKSLILPYDLMSTILLMISVYIVKLFPMIWFQFLAFLRFGSRVEKLFPLKKLPLIFLVTSTWRNTAFKKNYEVWDDPGEILKVLLGVTWDILHYNKNIVKSVHFILSFLGKVVIISISLYLKQLKIVNFVFL